MDNGKPELKPTGEIVEDGLEFVWDEEIGENVLVNKEEKGRIVRKQIERLLKLGGAVTS